MRNTLKYSVLNVTKQCMISTHSAHKMCNFTTGEKENIETLTEALLNKEKAADKTLDKIETIQSKFKKEMDQAEDQLDDYHTFSINQLSKQYKELKQQLENR